MFVDKAIQLVQIDYALSVEEIEQKFETNLKYGLEGDEAQTRLNYFCEMFEDEGKAKDWEIYKLIKNLIGIHNIPLWFGSALCMVVYLSENYLTFHDLAIKPDNFYISIGLMSFVCVFGVFSYYMDAKCEYYVDSCRDLIPQNVTVIREGCYKRIYFEELVAGDLLYFQSGDRLFADIKIVDCSGVTLNQELLADREIFYYEQLYGSCDRYFLPGDILFYSSYIFNGYGKGIVLRTKDNYLRHSKYQCQRYKFTNTSIYQNKRHNLYPLTNELNKFLHYLTLISIIVSSLVALSSTFFDKSWLRAVMFFIAVYVGIITEALLPTFNVTKAQIAKDLAIKNCYIQNIEALETLGATSLICTNKTGIITQTKMILSHIWIDNQIIASYEFMQKYKGVALDEPIMTFARTCALCIFANFADKETSLTPFRRETYGKPSEAALLCFMEAFTGGVEMYRQRFNRLIHIAFNSTNKCSLVAYQVENHLILAIKGQPEALIDCCQTIFTGTGLQEFDSASKNNLLAVVHDLCKKRERVLAVAQAIVPFDQFESHLEASYFENILQNQAFMFQFLGLISFQNPVRLSVPEAIFKCRRAGIKVVMMTGDHPATALSIAKTTGIVCQRSEHYFQQNSLDDSPRLVNNLITGADLTQMTDQQLKRILGSGCDLVFARISPEDKLRIANCCRQVRAILAMTGVRPADLNIFDRSHIRISLGQYGCDITQNHCDVILLDDNFTSIVQGIEKGRVLFENVKKSLVFTISSKPTQLCPYLFYLFLSIPQMISPITILAIDLLTDNLPPIALAYEKAESDVMLREPRHLKNERILDFKAIFMAIFFYGLIQFFSGFYAYIVVMTENGFQICDLLYIHDRWYSMAINDLQDSYGQEWTYLDRRKLEMVAQTAYFTTVLITRIAVLLCCRTRKDSLFDHFFRNRMVNFACFFIFFISLFVSYYPPLEFSIRMYPLKFTWWFLSVPFFILILLAEEARTYIVRHYPHSSIGQIMHF